MQIDAMPKHNLERPLKIAIVVFTSIPDGGAVAQRVLMMAKGLVALGHEVQVVVPYRFTPGPLAEEIDGVRIHWGACASRRIDRSWLGKLRKRYLLLKVMKRLAQTGLTWMMLYDMGLDGLPFILLARRHGVLVASDNCDTRCYADKATLPELMQILSAKLGHRLVTPYLHLNVAISKYLAKCLQTIAPQVPIVIAPAPVDTQKYIDHKAAAREFRRRSGINDAMVIGYFGSVWAVKGLEIVFQAAADLQQRGKDFKLLITGNLSANGNLMQLIEELKLKDRLILPGFLPREELIGTMSVADILVEPKIAHVANQAAFPQKLAEYLSLGKPIVASAIGDIPQYLSHGQNALLCEAGNPLALANEIEKLIDNNELRQKLGVKARETAVRCFDCEIIARRMESGFFEAETKRRSL